MNQNPQQDNLSKVLGIGVVLLFVFGGVFALPLVIGVVIFLVVRRKQQEGEPGTNPSADSARQKLTDFMDQFQTQQKTDQHEAMRDRQESDRHEATQSHQEFDPREAMHIQQEADYEGQNPQSGHMGRTMSQPIYRPPTTDGTFSSVPDEMLSESERYHLTEMGTGSHDDMAHRAEELKDLLKAGIIDKDEYDDRVRQLKTEYRRLRG